MGQLMRTAIAVPILTAMIVLSGSAQAQDQGGRFTIEKTPEGYVRMDTATGDMSVCKMQDGQIVCKMAADERAAFQDELQALQDRVAALEGRVGAGAPGGDGSANTLPSEEEFEKTMSYMERFMRRFMGIVKDFEGEPGNRT